MARLVQRIFFIDDSDDDEFFVRRAVNKQGIASELMRLQGGQEAIDHFSQTSGDPAQDHWSFCDLIFLDINMPSVGGFEVLQWLRAHRQVTPLPLIVMMSSSDHPGDIEQARELGADSYVVKPLGPHDFSRLAGELRLRWNHPL